MPRKGAFMSEPGTSPVAPTVKGLHLIAVHSFSTYRTVQLIRAVKDFGPIIFKLNFPCFSVFDEPCYRGPRSSANPYLLNHRLTLGGPSSSPGHCPSKAGDNPSSNCAPQQEWHRVCSFTSSEKPNPRFVERGGMPPWGEELGRIKFASVFFRALAPDHQGNAFVDASMSGADAVWVRVRALEQDLKAHRLQNRLSSTAGVCATSDLSVGAKADFPFWVRGEPKTKRLRQLEVEPRRRCCLSLREYSFSGYAFGDLDGPR